MVWIYYLTFEEEAAHLGLNYCLLMEFFFLSDCLINWVRVREAYIVKLIKCLGPGLFAIIVLVFQEFHSPQAPEGDLGKIQ